MRQTRSDQGPAPWAPAGRPRGSREGPELYAGILWRRCVGYLIDAIAVALLAMLLWATLGLAGLLSFGLLFPLQVAAVAVLPLVYHAGFVARRGATPGMALMDVAVRDLSGARCSLPQAVLMTVLFFTTVTLTSSLVLLVALFTERRRTLHDLLSNTLAVRRSQLRPAEPAGAAWSRDWRPQRH